MKERPIIMSGESVRAILEGRKTMTRRVVKPQPESQGISTSTEAGDMIYCWPHLYDDGWRDRFAKSPYGKPGDQLWVRETFTYITLAENEQRDTRLPDGTPVRMLFKADADVNGWADQCKWYSPIHMPRWASRITLEIVRVRVEKLQEISEADAMDEGLWDGSTSTGPEDWHRRKYRELWDQLNAERGYPWSSNPWVWVIEFRRII